MAKSSLFKLKYFLIERRLSFILLVFSLLALAYFFALKKYHFSTEICLFESLIFLIFHLLFVIILNRIHAFYHSKSAISIVHLSTLFVFVSFYLFIIFEYGNLFYQFDPKYASFEINSYLPKGIVSFLILLAVINQFWIDKHLVELEKRNQQFIEHEKRLIQVELSNLTQQFQPHFLFNSLNSISALVGSEPKEARRMILLLSDFLRISIRNKEQDFESLKNELEFLNLYLEIEKVRFGHRLNLNLVFPENADGIRIPSQMLQPLVENAIKFGLYGNVGELSIELKIELLAEKLIFSIQNPFDEHFENGKNGAGFGLKSIQQKLLFLYGRNDLLQIEKKEGLFSVTIEIPRPKDVKER